jgi:mono/diheme cytochrome c family protein
MNTGMKMLLCTALAASMMCAHAEPPPAQCPQPRFTGKAPPEYYERTNPLPAGSDLRAAERLYRGDGRGVACATCHGVNGEGSGPLADQFSPPPRNFRCAQTVNGIPDGQLFWIIRFGSPGTSMPAHPRMSDEQAWQMVLYLRQLAR